MSLTDVLAVYAALASTAAIVWSWYSWRRVPEAHIEIRSLSRESTDSITQFAAIAVNRSPHAVGLTNATVRSTWQLLVRYEGDDGRIVERGREHWPGPAAGPSSRMVFPPDFTGAVEQTIQTDVEIDLLAEEKSFPVTIEPGQGQKLSFAFPATEYAFLVSDRVEFCVKTNDGRTFSTRLD